MDKPIFYAVIVAGGSGTRMQTSTPKQFLLLNGLPIVMHTILKFSKNKYQPQIILVLAKNHLDTWTKLLKQFKLKTPITVIEGGNERFYSVKNSLNLINENAIVAIHDAVRPLLSDKLISQCYQNAIEKNNAVCALPSNDSVRWVNSKGQNKILARNQVFLIQTPQVFTISQLKKAYSVNYLSTFTDDASVVEHAGFTINLTEGETQNFKITHPIDLKIAESLLSQ
ncbi:MAG: 2-C-methyl-D-erythritol 4-phosphate cytidylyltransferase [Sphingobacteriales bacterium]|nr:MAG: 2-C-methyl-D-erythritol 4-phosphate cytidylyltransferase [Sphingobacteriales bacterium]TAF79165.1 MAG: 2-C-methyl-D-erythritol 4-phosphate cytidylyltransferase [Sphingobacteriales bacterium]